MKLYFFVDKESREKLERIYQKLTGKKLVPPVESSMEVIMKETPNVSELRKRTSFTKSPM